MSPNLLVQRLRALDEDGMVRRSQAPQRSRSVTYELTPAGLALEGTVFELIRWGSRWMTTGPQGDHVDSAWSILALRALLDGTPNAGATGIVHVNADGQWLTIQMHRGRRSVRAGRSGSAQATVSAGFPALLEVAAGLTTLTAGDVTITGDQTAAARSLSPSGR